MKPLPFITAIAAAAAFTTPLRADITFVGSVEGIEVNDWRTAATPKNLDIDGDNIYGSFGAINWRPGDDTTQSVGLQSAGSNLLGFANVGGTTFGQYSDSNYALFDAIDGTGDVPAGINAVGTPGSYVFELTGTAEDYLGRTVRVGFGADVLTAGEYSADQQKSFELTGPGGADSGLVPLRNGGSGNGQPEFYFFDITGVSPGDQFTVTTGNGPDQPGYIGPVTFDIVPEPGSVAFAVLGGAGVLGLIRRRRA